MPPISEQQAADYIRSLYELEHSPDPQKAIIHLGPFSAFVLIGALQLAMRHPEFSRTRAELLAQVIDQMKPLFAGTLAEQILELGNHPEFDIPRGCRYPFGSHAPECLPGDHAGFADLISESAGYADNPGPEARAMIEHRARSEQDAMDAAVWPDGRTGREHREAP